MMKNMKSTAAIHPGDRFVRHHDVRMFGDNAPIYTAQSVRKFGSTVFIYCDRGLVRANLAGSVLSVA